MLSYYRLAVTANTKINIKADLYHHFGRHDLTRQAPTGKEVFIARLLASRFSCHARINHYGAIIQVVLTQGYMCGIYNFAEKDVDLIYDQIVEHLIK